jgi:hypothetical protein
MSRRGKMKKKGTDNDVISISPDSGSELSLQGSSDVGLVRGDSASTLSPSELNEAVKEMIKPRKKTCDKLCSGTCVV